MIGLGVHYLAEYYNCNVLAINDIEVIESIMTTAADLAEATIVKTFCHQFSPHGVSGVVVIAESHLTIHTWPEYEYAAVDLFSCSDFNYRIALDYIKDNINAQKMIISSVDRGILPEEGEDPQPLKISDKNYSSLPEK